MEKDSSVNTTITTLSTGLVIIRNFEFSPRVNLPFVIENRILSAILLCVGAAISLRFCFGSVSLTEFIAAVLLGWL